MNESVGPGRSSPALIGGRAPSSYGALRGQPLGGRSPLGGGGAEPGGAESVAEGTPSSTLRAFFVRRALPALVLGVACAAGATEAKAQTCYEEDGCDSSANANYSAVLGGRYCTIAAAAAGQTDSNYAAVAGGYSNEIKPGSRHSAIAGGDDSRIENAPYAFIGGGEENVCFNASEATIMGGRSGHVAAQYATIGGGEFNDISGIGIDDPARSGTILGGSANDSGVHYGTLGGGTNNRVINWGPSPTAGTVVGGGTNLTAAASATVLGGAGNEASGRYSTTVGGYFNRAEGSWSLAAGDAAQADRDGCFVWADQGGGLEESPECKIHPLGQTPYSASNVFVARARGGFEFVTNVDAAGTPNAGVRLGAGGSVWLSVSDRDRKHGFQEIDPREVLRRVVALPITTWKYDAEVSGARHMGPMAQDFHAAFGLGDDDRHVTSIDEAGVVLGAIQGLDAVCKDGDAALDALRGRVSAAEDEEKARGTETERALSAAEARAAALEARLGITE